jgi:hypothetical protein
MDKDKDSRSEAKERLLTAAHALYMSHAQKLGYYSDCVYWDICKIRERMQQEHGLTASEDIALASSLNYSSYMIDNILSLTEKDGNFLGKGS